jgi:hypothetical protein
MAKKHLKEAAARARASRWTRNAFETHSDSPETVPRTESDEFSHGNSSPSHENTDNTGWSLTDSESESDCGYTGGVNMDMSDSDEEGSDWVDSDAESLSEFSGSELDVNLEELQQEAEDLRKPMVNWKIMERKSPKEWAKAEKNRGLGYTGLSDRTRQRREKEARDRAAFWDAAQTS